MAHITLSNDGSLRAPHGTIGNAIKQLREKRELSQLQLGEKVGVTQSTIASYECGRIRPSVKVVQRLALEFNVPLEYILAHRRSLFRA